MEFEKYRLPNRRVVSIDAELTKGAPTISFTMKGGAVVDAVRVVEDPKRLADYLRVLQSALIDATNAATEAKDEANEEGFPPRVGEELEAIETAVDDLLRRSQQLTRRLEVENE